MGLSLQLSDFINAHAADDTDKLLLSASRYPDIDIPFAVDQILARRQIQQKLPLWHSQPGLIYPSRLSAEQCSSEQTALYKQRLLKGNTLCDLTGGLGVDTYYLSQKARQVIYIERFAGYCEAAKHNFDLLKARNIQTINADVREIADTLKADTFYIDPARRADCNKRTYALADCEPDIIRLKPLLLENSQRLIIKISPMADLDETVRLLPETREIHILSVKNECKELLFLLEKENHCESGKIEIHAVNLSPDAQEQEFVFRQEEEKAACLQTSQTICQYLYEPNASLLKSGAFKLAALRFGLYKLHRHSHLYTSDTPCPDFPGRVFIVDEILAFSGKLLKQINRKIPQANITTRNFPLTVAEIRKRSGIKEGGEVYLFATTLANEQKVILQVHKI